MQDVQKLERPAAEDNLSESLARFIGDTSIFRDVVTLLDPGLRQNFGQDFGSDFLQADNVGVGLLKNVEKKRSTVFREKLFSIVDIEQGIPCYDLDAANGDGRQNVGDGCVDPGALFCVVSECCS